MDIASAGYPLKFAFGGAASGANPYINIINRLQVVQFEDFEGSLRTLAYEPTVPEGPVEAPFYAQMVERPGEFLAYKVLATIWNHPDEALAKAGLEVEDVDYVSFDHSNWLGLVAAPRLILLLVNDTRRPAPSMSWVHVDNRAGIRHESCGRADRRRARDRGREAGVHLLRRGQPRSAAIPNGSATPRMKQRTPEAPGESGRLMIWAYGPPGRRTAHRGDLFEACRFCLVYFVSYIYCYPA